MTSLIQTIDWCFRAKKVCKVAPLAGETKVWQYITLMRKIYLIDCPGVVYSGKETDEEKVLKGVVRVEMVDQPYDYIPTVLARVKREYLARTYRIEVSSSKKRKRHEKGQCLAKVFLRLHFGPDFGQIYNFSTALALTK